jgi:predicted double-glycine peptidase
MKRLIVCIFSWILFWNLPVFSLTKIQAIQFFNLDPNNSSTFLDIKAYQQTKDYTCGPCAVMQILKYYGFLTDRDMNKITELCIAREMGTSQQTGTSEQQITHWLQAHGFKVKVGYNGTIALLRDNLNKGIPTLVDWIDWGGHWVAVVGLDETNSHSHSKCNTIFFADSAAKYNYIKHQDGITSFNVERFSTMWFNSEHKENIYIYIVATPKNLSKLKNNF